jgi:hypothetical protein
VQLHTYSDPLKVAELAILAENNSRLYHICGITCGIFILLLMPFSSNIQVSWRFGIHVVIFGTFHKGDYLVLSPS